MDVIKMNRPRWALGFVMMILGLLLTIQFRIYNQTSLDPSKMRADELVAALSEKQKELEAATAKVTDLEKQVTRLQESLLNIGPAPSEDTTQLQILAGTVEVVGSGVVVTLTETPESLTAKNKVADEDIWRVLNELFTAGAEAVSVNGVRITSVTGIRNVGNRILVNQTMIASPVEIQAVGDPAVLESSLKLRGGVVELLGRWGIKVTVAKNEALTIPGVKSPPIFRWAKPPEKKP